MIGKLSSSLSLESQSSDADDHDKILATEQICTEMNSLLVVSSGTAGTNRMEHVGSTSGLDTVMQEASSKVQSKLKALKRENVSTGKSKHSIGKTLNSTDRKQKTLAAVSELSQNTSCQKVEVRGSDKSHKESVDESIGHSSGADIFCGDKINTADAEKSAISSSILSKAQYSPGWSNLEKNLYLKGIEIFGKNRYCNFYGSILVSKK